MRALPRPGSRPTRPGWQSTLERRAPFDAITPMRAVSGSPSATADREAIEWIDDAGRLEEIAGPWERLADEEPLPFLRHAWMAAWYAAFGAGRAPAVAALWRGAELAGVLPLVDDGDRPAAMANDESPAFAPLARDDAAHAALVAALAERAPGGLALGNVPAGPALERLERDLARSGLVTDSRAFRASPVVETDGTYEAWRELTKPRWRAQLDRLRRKAAREHDLEFALLREPADLERELDRGLAVEASGWKGAEGTAIDAAPATAAFYRDVARRFHALGELRVSSMTLDGEVVAFDLCLLHGNRLWLLKTGYQPAARRAAPGLVLHLTVIERCFEDGLDAFELLGDEEEWKQKFATATRETRTLRAAPRRSARALPLALRRVARPLVRRVRRRGEDPAGGRGGA